VRTRWSEIYGGVDNWDQVGVLDQTGEYKRIGYSFDEMGFEVLDERNETRILGPFGVPPILIGSRVGLARSTYSNYEQARDAFWQDTAIHEMRLFEDDLQYHLSSGGAWVAFDYSDVPAFQNDLPPIVDAWVKLVSLGVPKAQAAEVVGLPLGDLEDGDVAYMPLGLVPLQEAAEARQANRDALAESRNSGNDERGKDKGMARKYDPDQPRDPAGTPTGGQWTSEGGASSVNVITDHRKIAEYLADSYEKKYGWGDGKTREGFIKNQINSLKNSDKVPQEFIDRVTSDINAEIARGVPNDVPVIIHGMREGFNDKWVEAQHDGNAIRFIYDPNKAIVPPGSQTVEQSPPSISATYASQYGGTFVHEVGHSFHESNLDTLSRARSVVDERRTWIKLNISRYAIQNERELVAEVYALYHHPNYRNLSPETQEFTRFILGGNKSIAAYDVKKNYSTRTNGASGAKPMQLVGTTNAGSRLAQKARWRKTSEKSSAD